MVLGDTAKRIQRIVELAEDLYERVNELRRQILALRETVEETSGRVVELEHELDRQRALLEALADDRGIDVEAVLEGTGEDESEDVDDDAADGG